MYHVRAAGGSVYQNTVLAVFATGIHFLAMSMTKPGGRAAMPDASAKPGPVGQAYQQNPHSPEIAIH
ncbi:hypothetical protein ACNKHR_18945 [Shigella flexneri]